MNEPHNAMASLPTNRSPCQPPSQAGLPVRAADPSQSVSDGVTGSAVSFSRISPSAVNQSPGSPAQTVPTAPPATCRGTSPGVTAGVDVGLASPGLLSSKQHSSPIQPPSALAANAPPPLPVFPTGSSTPSGAGTTATSTRPLSPQLGLPTSTDVPDRESKAPSKEDVVQEDGDTAAKLLPHPPALTPANGDTVDKADQPSASEPLDTVPEAAASLASATLTNLNDDEITKILEQAKRHNLLPTESSESTEKLLRQIELEHVRTSDDPIPDASPPHTPSSRSVIPETSPRVLPLVTADVDAKISAYARLDFAEFTFYVQTLQVLLGRRTSGASPSASQHAQASGHLVDVHLGSTKAISRRHAKIFYNFGTQRFELSVMGRNGAFVDDTFVEMGVTVPLKNRTKVQIGKPWFVFVLPEAEAEAESEANEEAVPEAEASATVPGPTRREKRREKKKKKKKKKEEKKKEEKKKEEEKQKEEQKKEEGKKSQDPPVPSHPPQSSAAAGRKDSIATLLTSVLGPPRTSIEDQIVELGGLLEAVSNPSDTATASTAPSILSLLSSIQTPSALELQLQSEVGDLVGNLITHNPALDELDLDDNTLEEELARLEYIQSLYEDSLPPEILEPIMNGTADPSLANLGYLGPRVAPKPQIGMTQQQAHIEFQAMQKRQAEAARIAAIKEQQKQQLLQQQEQQRLIQQKLQQQKQQQLQQQQQQQLLQKQQQLLRQQQLQIQEQQRKLAAQALAVKGGYASSKGTYPLVVGAHAPPRYMVPKSTGSSVLGTSGMGTSGVGGSGVPGVRGGWYKPGSHPSTLGGTIYTPNGVAQPVSLSGTQPGRPGPYLSAATYRGKMSTASEQGAEGSFGATASEHFGTSDNGGDDTSSGAYGSASGVGGAYQNRKPARGPKRTYLPDEIPHQFRAKPACSYSLLIVTCLKLHGTERGMSLLEIYAAIREVFPYYQYCLDGWQLSVRHNLSLNKQFKKVSKEGKGWLWGLNEDFNEGDDNLYLPAGGASPRPAAPGSIQAQLAANRLAPAAGLNDETMKSLAYLQKELVKLTSERKFKYDKAITTAILTQALAMTIAQVTQVAQKAGMTGNPLATLIERTPQHLTKILGMALNAATLQVLKRQPAPAGVPAVSAVARSAAVPVASPVASSMASSTAPAAASPVAPLAVLPAVPPVVPSVADVPVGGRLTFTPPVTPASIAVADAKEAVVRPAPSLERSSAPPAPPPNAPTHSASPMGSTAVTVPVSEDRASTASVRVQEEAPLAQADGPTGALPTSSGPLEPVMAVSLPASLPVEARPPLPLGTKRLLDDAEHSVAKVMKPSDS